MQNAPIRVIFQNLVTFVGALHACCAYLHVNVNNLLPIIIDVQILLLYYGDNVLLAEECQSSSLAISLECFLNLISKINLIKT